jgi:hypothetical protein
MPLGPACQPPVSTPRRPACSCSLLHPATATGNPRHHAPPVSRPRPRHRAPPSSPIAVAPARRVLPAAVGAARSRRVHAVPTHVVEPRPPFRSFSCPHATPSRPPPPPFPSPPRALRAFKSRGLPPRLDRTARPWPSWLVGRPHLAGRASRAL